MSESLFAEVDPATNKVLRVIVIEQAELNKGTRGDPRNWKRTYNDGRPGHKYAGKGDIYNPVTGNFSAPKHLLKQETPDVLAINTT